MNWMDIKKSWVSDDVTEILESEFSYVRSRYDKKDRYRLNDGSLIIRPIKLNDLVPIRTSSDIFYTIKGEETFRPDIVANKFYNNPKLYWVILSANGIKDVLDFSSGIEIVIPSIMSIYGTGGVMI